MLQIVTKKLTIKFINFNVFAIKNTEYCVKHLTFTVLKLTCKTLTKRVLINNYKVM